jgi:hypothetical protein
MHHHPWLVAATLLFATPHTSAMTEDEIISEHLASVEAGLRDRTHPDQTPAQRLARRRNLDVLAEYRERGETQAPHLGAWLPSSGLTAQEAAWIQPGYE